MAYWCGDKEQRERYMRSGVERIPATNSTDAVDVDAWVRMVAWIPNSNNSGKKGDPNSPTCFIVYDFQSMLV